MMLQKLFIIHTIVSGKSKILGVFTEESDATACGVFWEENLPQTIWLSVEMIEQIEIDAPEDLEQTEYDRGYDAGFNAAMQKMIEYAKSWE